MQWGISFTLESEFEAELYSLPPASSKRYLTRMNKANLISILYHFQYTPQSWKEWQRVSSIKIQMKQKAPHIRFVDYEPQEVVEYIYTVSELGKHFTEFIKFQKPLYPSDKSEFMSFLTLYTIRLYYEHQLHHEAVIAMALRFNSISSLGYSFRELNRKVIAILKLDRSEWKLKLSKKDLKLAHKRGNEISSQKMRDKSKPIRDKAAHLRVEGNTLSHISKILGISLSTVKRWKLPKR